jgi:hypothetical protein
LTFTITNPNAGVTLTGVAFTDTLPERTGGGNAQRSERNVRRRHDHCHGGCRYGKPLRSDAGRNTSCTFSVNVHRTTAGVKANSVTVSSTQTGTGNTATANVTVVAPAHDRKDLGPFGAVNSGTSLTFTLTNPNVATALSGIGFTDTLPAGLVVSTPNCLIGSCTGGNDHGCCRIEQCQLVGSDVGANASCTFSVNVTAHLPDRRTTSPVR